MKTRKELIEAVEPRFRSSYVVGSIGMIMKLGYDDKRTLKEIEDVLSVYEEITERELRIIENEIHGKK